MTPQEEEIKLLEEEIKLLEQLEARNVTTPFDPEGSGYDYATADRYGIKPDETGHWPSRVPQTGQLLKGRNHETFYKTVQGEKEAGYQIYKGEDGKYYSKKEPGVVEDIAGGAKQLGEDVVNIAKNPWSIAEGATQLITSTPAFMSGAMRAIQEGAKTLVAGGDLEDAWDNMVGGFEEYFNKTAEIIPPYTPKDAKGAEAATKIYMTPFLATNALAEDVAKKVEKDNPNTAAAIRMAGQVAGFAAQGGMHKSMNPGSKGPKFPRQEMDVDVPLDTTFAKKLLSDKINMERVNVPGKPLSRLSMVEESLKADREFATPTKRIQQAVETFENASREDLMTPAERSARIIESVFGENTTPQAREAVRSNLAQRQAAGRPEFQELARKQTQVQQQMKIAEELGDTYGPSTPRTQLPEARTPNDPVLPVTTKTAPIPKGAITTPEKTVTYKGFILEEDQLAKAMNKRRAADIFKDINTALGERGSTSGKLTTEQQAARRRLLRDLDTIKRNARRTGKEVKQYLLDLGTDPDVINLLTDKQLSAEIKPKPRNVTIPEKEKSLTHYEDIVHAMEEDSGTLSGGMQYMGEQLNSPDLVFNRMGEPGKKIYREYEIQEAKGNAFEFNRGKAADKVTTKRGIKEGDVSDLRIAQALDGKLDPETLSNKEHTAYKWYRDEYDNLLQKYAFKRASSPKVYSEIMRQTKNKNMDKTWFKSLSQGDKEIASLLNRRITNYLPHVFDQRFLRRELLKELATETNPRNIGKLESTLDTLNKGEFVLTQDLPKSIRNRFLEKRTGREDYNPSAIKAYRSYLTAMRRKMYDEPAIQNAGKYHKQLPSSYRDYNIKFARQWMGMDKTTGDALADAIATIQWTRTLGFNPRTALQNKTQVINTIIEAPKASIKAYGQILRNYPKAKQLFEKSGLANEIPQALTEVSQGFSGKWKDLRKIAGFMHNMTERGNRMHALVTGYIKDGGKLDGTINKDHMQAGVDMAHKTQFAYGRLGMPMILRNPIGRVALQFSSFPIKQMELMKKWAVEDPAKLVGYLALSYGTVKTAKELLDIDFSNALGIGPTTYGQAIEILRNIRDEDWRGAIREARVGFSEGTGILPTGPGPTVTAGLKLANAFGEGRFTDELKKQAYPVMYQRLARAYESIVKKYDDQEQYPIFSRNGDLMYELTGRELATSTFGPRVVKESEEYSSYFRNKLLDQDHDRIMEEVTKAILEGDDSKVDDLINKYGIYPSVDTLVNAIMRRSVDSKTRRMMGRTQKELEFYLQETPEDSPYQEY